MATATTKCPTITDERVQEIADNFAAQFIHLAHQYPLWLEQAGEFHGNAPAIKKLGKIVGDQLKAFSPKYSGIEDLLCAAADRNWPVVFEHFKAMLGPIGSGFTGNINIMDAFGEDAKMSIGGPSATEGRQMTPHQIATSHWIDFCEWQFDKATKRGDVENGEPYFTAQVALRGGHNMGVGVVTHAPKDGNLYAPHNGDWHLLRITTTGMDRETKRMIATEGYFDISDVQSMTVVVAIAEEKKPSQILMG